MGLQSQNVSLSLSLSPLSLQSRREDRESREGGAERRRGVARDEGGRGEEEGIWSGASKLECRSANVVPCNTNIAELLMMPLIHYCCSQMLLGHLSLFSAQVP